MFPSKPQGQEEMDMIKKAIDGLKGAENGGKSAAFFANRNEDLPRFEVIPSNTNDGLFQNTTESIENKICQAHTIDPILMGIRVSGKLGSGTDIKQAYTIFEKNVVMPLRDEVEYIYNSLFELVDMDVQLKINEFQIIGEQIVDKTEE
jgi:capsid portal protein